MKPPWNEPQVKAVLGNGRSDYDSVVKQNVLGTGGSPGVPENFANGKTIMNLGWWNILHHTRLTCSQKLFSCGIRSMDSHLCLLLVQCLLELDKIARLATLLVVTVHQLQFLQLAANREIGVVAIPKAIHHMMESYQKQKEDLDRTLTGKKWWWWHCQQ